MSPEDDSYERLPYDGGVAADALPAQLAAAARCAGWPLPPATQRRRVLELGCGIGTNLLSIAALDPRCDCVGIDRSPRQIAWAADRARALGLPNVRWIAADIAALAPLGLGRFDFIICHGVYSWVGAPVREALLAAVADHLAPQGLAYISHNIRAGWATGLAMREALLELVPRGAEPAEQVAAARRALAWMAAAAGDDPAGHPITALVRQLERAPDDYLFHEYLEAENAPASMRDFAAALGRHGLRWLAEAGTASRWPRLEPPLAQALDAMADPIERQHRLDLIFFNPFRRSLCVRADAGGLPPDPPPHDILADLHLAAALRLPERIGWGLLEPLDCSLPSGQTLRAMLPITKAACIELAARWPATVEGAQLLQAARLRLQAAGCTGADTPAEAEARQLTGFLWVAVRAGQVEALAWPRTAAAALAHGPHAWPLARLLAAEGRPALPTALHTHVLADGPERALLQRCDGTRRVEDIARELRGEPDGAALADALPERLEQWRLSGLLWPTGPGAASVRP